jgi:hypothetical protein
VWAERRSKILYSNDRPQTVNVKTEVFVSLAIMIVSSYFFTSDRLIMSLVQFNWRAKILWLVLLFPHAGTNGGIDIRTGLLRQT